MVRKLVSTYLFIQVGFVGTAENSKIDFAMFDIPFILRVHKELIIRMY